MHRKISRGAIAARSASAAARGGHRDHRGGRTIVAHSTCRASFPAVWLSPSTSPALHRCQDRGTGKSASISLVDVFFLFPCLQPSHAQPAATEKNSSGRASGARPGLPLVRAPNGCHQAGLGRVHVLGASFLTMRTVACRPLAQRVDADRGRGRGATSRIAGRKVRCCSALAAARAAVFSRLLNIDRKASKPGAAVCLLAG